MAPPLKIILGDKGWNLGNFLSKTSKECGRDSLQLVVQINSSLDCYCKRIHVNCPKKFVLHKHLSGQLGSKLSHNKYPKKNKNKNKTPKTNTYLGSWISYGYSHQTKTRKHPPQRPKHINKQSCNLKQKKQKNKTKLLRLVT